MLRTLSVVAVAAHALACAAPPAEEPQAEDNHTGVYGTAPAAVGGIASVVTLTPAGSEPPVPIEAHIDQIGLQFSPTRLVVPAGSTVRFTNSETLTHNVQLRRVGESVPFFDRDTDPDEVADFTFDEPGGVDVACAAHPGMQAFIFVTEAPLSALAELDGSFAFPEAAPGTYQLAIWSVDPEQRVTRTLSVESLPFEVPAGR